MTKRNHPIYLEDETRGRQGTLEKIITTNEDGEKLQPSPEAEVDEVCRIKYNPSVTPRNSIKDWIKTVLPFFDTSVVTEEKFPRESVYTVTNNRTVERKPGEPKEFLRIEETEKGENEHAQEVGKARDRKISTVQKQRDRAKRTGRQKDWDNMDQKKDDDDDYQRRGGQNRDELFREESRVR